MTKLKLTEAQLRTLKQIADPDYKGSRKYLDHNNIAHYRYPNVKALLDKGMVECEYWVGWGGEITDNIEKVQLSDAGRAYLANLEASPKPQPVTRTALYVGMETQIMYERDAALGEVNRLLDQLDNITAERDAFKKLLEDVLEYHHSVPPFGEPFKFNEKQIRDSNLIAKIEAALNK